MTSNWQSGSGGSSGAGASGLRLRLARQARGFSQQQLAGMAEVSRQAVSAVESGISDPSLRVALALARALGLTVEELFGPAIAEPVVAARPLAPLGPPGSRVSLAQVGDDVRRPAAVRSDRDQGRLLAGRAAAPTGPRRCGRSGRRGRLSWWPAVTRRCRSSTCR